MVLPLRVWLHEPSGEVAALAHTLDISPIGGRLGGLRTPVEPGQTITLQRGQRKSQFRVVWSKQLGPSEVQAGVETIEIGKNLWDVELPHQLLPEHEAPAKPASVEEKEAVTQDVEVPVLTGARPPAIHVRAHAGHSRMRWIAGLGMLLFVAMLSVLIRYEVFRQTPIAGPRIPTPTTPTEAQLAAMTPKPIKLVALASADANALQRVQVAEAPKGRIAYPVAPAGDARGKVDLKVVIATDGRVKEVLLVSGRQLLASAAEQAVKLWHYREHERNGSPVEAETRVTVSFLGNDAVSVRFPASNDFRVN